MNGGVLMHLQKVSGPYQPAQYAQADMGRKLFVVLELSMSEGQFTIMIRSVDIYL